jgi:hypothetical protein
MRDYSKVGPKFWIGETGKALRRHMEAQIVAMYLMTCPNSEMTGVFYCPIGLLLPKLDWARKGLRRAFKG